MQSPFTVEILLFFHAEKTNYLITLLRLRATLDTSGFCFRAAVLFPAAAATQRSSVIGPQFGSGRGQVAQKKNTAAVNQALDTALRFLQGRVGVSDIRVGSEGRAAIEFNTSGDTNPVDATALY